MPDVTVDRRDVRKVFDKLFFPTFEPYAAAMLLVTIGGVLVAPETAHADLQADVVPGQP